MNKNLYLLKIFTYLTQVPSFIFSNKLKKLIKLLVNILLFLKSQKQFEEFINQFFFDRRASNH